MRKYQKRFISFALVCMMLLSNASIVMAATYRTGTGENLVGIGRDSQFKSFYGESNDGTLVMQPDLTKAWEEFAAAVSELETMLNKFNSSSSEIGLVETVKACLSDVGIESDTVDYDYLMKWLQSPNVNLGSGRVEDLKKIREAIDAWDRSSTVGVYGSEIGENSTKTVNLTTLKLRLLEIEFQSLKVQALGGIVFSYDGLALQNGITTDKERTSTEAKVLLSIINEHSKRGDVSLEAIKAEFIDKMSGDQYKTLYTNDETPETQVERMTDRNILIDGDKSSKYLTNFFNNNSQANMNLYYF